MCYLCTSCTKWNQVLGILETLNAESFWYVQRIVHGLRAPITWTMKATASHRLALMYASALAVEPFRMRTAHAMEEPSTSNQFGQNPERLFDRSWSQSWNLESLCLQQQSLSGSMALIFLVFGQFVLVLLGILGTLTMAHALCNATLVRKPIPTPTDPRSPAVSRQREEASPNKTAAIV